MTASPPWKTAWITGASSGIGREVAIQLAARGVTVAASARSSEKLAQLGPGIHPYPLDVTDRQAVTATLTHIERDLGAIDLAVLGAGTYSPVSPGNFDAALFETMMTTNYMGVVNALGALLPRMKQRGRGHVAWIGSVAGYRGLPNAAAYGPSKAALINLAECLKPELDPNGVSVSLINPGFVATPLTDQNEFPMPFLMQAPEAARLAIRGLERKRFEIAFPWRFVMMLKIARIFPYALYFQLIRRFILRR